MSTHGQFGVVEKSVVDLRLALDTGAVTSLELVHRHLERIDHHDHHGIRRNAVPSELP